MSNEKHQWRLWLKQQRNALSSQDITMLSNTIVTHLINTEIFKKSEHVACYVSTKNEVATHALIEHIFACNKTCYLPHVTQGRMKFLAYAKNDGLTLNAMGILQPEHTEPHYDANHMDIIIAPLLGFDNAGHRLGMGGGYYDRALMGLKNASVKKTRVIGLAFECQRVAHLCIEPWDVSLHAIVTEQGLAFF